MVGRNQSASNNPRGKNNYVGLHYFMDQVYRLISRIGFFNQDEKKIETKLLDATKAVAAFKRNEFKKSNEVLYNLYISWSNLSDVEDKFSSNVDEYNNWVNKKFASYVTGYLNGTSTLPELEDCLKWVSDDNKKNILKALQTIEDSDLKGSDEYKKLNVVKKELLVQIEGAWAFFSFNTDAKFHLKSILQSERPDILHIKRLNEVIGNGWFVNPKFTAMKEAYVKVKADPNATQNEPNDDPTNRGPK